MMIKSSVFFLLACIVVVHSQSGNYRIANAIGSTLALGFSDQSTLTLAPATVSNYTSVANGNISIISATSGSNTYVNATNPILLSSSGAYNTFALIITNNGTGMFTSVLITETFEGNISSTSGAVVRFIDLSIQFVSANLQATGSSGYIDQYATYLSASEFVETGTNFTSFTITSDTGATIATVPASLAVGFAYSVFLFDNFAGTSMTNATGVATLDHAFTANTTNTTSGSMNMTTGMMMNMTTGMMNMTTGMANMTTGMMANMTTGMMMNMTTGMMVNATTGMMMNSTTGMMMNMTTGMMPMNMTTGMHMNMTTGMMPMNMTTGTPTTHFATPTTHAFVTTASHSFAQSQLASIAVGLIAFAIALTI